MGFLSPFLLVSSAALAVPLWLHLRRKRRQTPVEFPSLRYLKAATARVKRQAKVEDILLLLLRMLVLALLAAAFARPVVRSSGSWLGATRSVESVVVIDATASMGWKGPSGTRLDESKKLAREWITGLDRRDAVALWVLTDRLEKPVPVPITDRGFLFKQLDAVVVSDGSSSLASVFNAAGEWAKSRGISRKELCVITDNQAAAWDWPAEAFFRNSWNRSGVSLVVLLPDSNRASNVVVESVDWDSRTVHEGGLINGVAKISNDGDAAVSDVLECRIGGQSVFRKPVQIPVGGSVEIPIAVAVPAVTGPVLTGELAIAGDALSCDDHWYFALPIRHPLHSIVVERGTELGASMRPSFFLTRALAAGGAGKATAIDSAAWSKQSTDGVDSVWFTSGAANDAAAWAKARAYAESGGTVVVTGDSQPNPLPKDWPVTVGEEVALPAGRVATRLLAMTDPLFDGVWSDQAPFPPLSQRVARKCVAADGSRVLATLAGELPLLVETPVGKGRVLWLNASVDRTWGDLPLSSAYVVLVQQIARARELKLQAVSQCQVGEAWPDLTKFDDGAKWPAGRDGASITRALHAGIFEAVSKDEKPCWSCAVNVRRAESDLRAVDSAKLQAMLPGKVIAGQQGVREWREETQREVPLWPWLLAAAALVYLAEGWLSARAASQRETIIGADFAKFTAGRTQV